MYKNLGDVLTCKLADKPPYILLNEWRVWLRLQYIPGPDRDGKYDLIGVWTVARPVIDDKHWDREGTGRRNLEHHERRYVLIENVARQLEYLPHREIFYL
jgi:hypothetical protein